MSRLVVVVPLKEGARKRAELLEKGPPFDVEVTHPRRHEVFLSDNEVIFDSRPPAASRL